MPIYEIVNPSDTCTIEAPNDTIAAVAILYLGTGYYGCTKEDGSNLPTLVAFGGESALDEALDSLGIGKRDDDSRLNAYIESHALEIAEALESIAYCKISTRKALLLAFEDLPDRTERLKKFNDEKRSSLNDINESAHELARVLRNRSVADDKTD